MGTPDFMTIGVMRSGTSTLYRMLEAHPALQAPHHKEINFFCDDTFKNTSLSHYRGLFPDPQPGKLRFEVSPFYFGYHQAPARIKKHIPEIRLFIILLRDPIRRAWSEFTVRRGETAATFNAESRLLRRGFYDEDLAAWFAVFPRDQFLIWGAEEFFENPMGLIMAIEDRLYLAQKCPRDFRWDTYFWDPMEHRRRRKGRGYPAIPPQTFKRLREIYQPHVRRLKEMTHRNFPRWEKY